MNLYCDDDDDDTDDIEADDGNDDADDVDADNDADDIDSSVSFKDIASDSRVSFGTRTIDSSVSSGDNRTRTIDSSVSFEDKSTDQWWIYLRNETLLSMLVSVSASIRMLICDRCYITHEYYRCAPPARTRPTTSPTGVLACRLCRSTSTGCTSGGS